MVNFFPNLVGTIAVILVVTEIISGFEVFVGSGQRNWKTYLFAGLVGGLFGVYANLTGVEYRSAIITVRDAGPMLAGYLAGPFGGVIAGLICGIHRYTMGGITAQACIAATCLIGFFCGFFFDNRRGEKIKMKTALSVGAGMEMFHLLLVLLLVEPFETAVDIVTVIAIPFIIVNSIGFAMMVTVLDYLEVQRQLMNDKTRMESELEVAKTIQMSLLPPVTAEFPFKTTNYVFDLGTLILPARKVGGDFYDFFMIDRTHFAFLISDVSGKGIAAAMFMASAKMTLQNCLKDFHDLGQAVRRANETMCQNNEAEMFVTSWIGVLDLETLEVKFVSAGHNPPLLIRNGKAEYIKYKNSFILAGMKGVKYNVNSIQLQKDDALYLYTDGVSEASNKENELYGEARLQKCLNGMETIVPNEIVKAVNKDVEKFVAGHEQSDDITMMAIKIN